MSFRITEHQCKRCNGWFEKWLHTESGELYIHHDLGMNNKKLAPLCGCTRPLE